MTRVAINGFGRIGRQVLLVILGRHQGELEVAAVSDVMSLQERAYLLAHDTVYGKRLPVRTEGDKLCVAGKYIPQYDARGLNPFWASREAGADIVIEASGDPLFHLLVEGSVKAVIVTAPHMGADDTLVYGVNHQDYDPEGQRIISAASCTTNCVANVLKVLKDRFGVDRAFLDSVNAYTNSQRLVDSANLDLRRARAAGLNIVPTESSTDSSIARFFPDIVFSARAFRVPVACGSVASLWVLLNEPATAREVNTALKEAAEAQPDVMCYEWDSLVSSDIIGESRAAVVDGMLTEVSGPWAHVVAWYDNEYGYACQVARLAAHIAKRLKEKPISV